MSIFKTLMTNGDNTVERLLREVIGLREDVLKLTIAEHYARESREHNVDNITVDSIQYKDLRMYKRADNLNAGITANDLYINRIELNDFSYKIKSGTWVKFIERERDTETFVFKVALMHTVNDIIHSPGMISDRLVATTNANIFKVDYTSLFLEDFKKNLEKALESIERIKGE